MAKNFIFVNTNADYEESAGAFEQTDFINSSAGVGDAGKPILLNASGVLDNTFIDASAIDHGSLSGLGDDDHTQYILVDGSRAFSGDQSMGSNKLTNLADATGNNDAVNLGQLNAAFNNLDRKNSVRLVATSDLSLSGEQTIDGVLTSADRVLLTGQTDASENGIYVTAAGAWSRSDDANTDAKVTSGLQTTVEEGSTKAGTIWLLTTADPIVLDTTNLTFTELSINTLTASLGVELVGSNLQADLVAAGGIKLIGNELAIEPNDLVGEGLIDDGSDNFAIDWSTAFNDAKAVRAQDLSSNSNGFGASIIGLEDPGGLITALTVEGGLVENRTAIDAIEDNTITGGTGITSSGTIGADDQSIAIDTASTVNFTGGVWTFTNDSLQVTGNPDSDNDAVNKAYVDANSSGLQFLDPVWFVDLVADNYGAGTHVKDYQTPSNSTVDIEGTDMVIADLSATYRAVGITGTTTDTAAGPGDVMRFNDDADNGNATPSWSNLGHLSNTTLFPLNSRWGVSIDTDVVPTGTFDSERGYIKILTSNGTAGNYDQTWATAAEFVTSGTGAQESFDVTLPAGSTFTSSGAADYWLFESDKDEYYVWFDVSNGNTDPAPAGSEGGGKIGLEIDVTAADSAATVASAVQTAINARTEITATVLSAVVSVSMDNNAAVKGPEDVNAGVTFANEVQGNWATGPQNQFSFLVDNPNSNNAFKQFTYNATLGRWQFSGASQQVTAGAGLSFSGNQLNVNVDDVGIEIVSDTLQLKDDGVKDAKIDWGTGAGQVAADDMPIVDSGGLFTTDFVEDALAEVMTDVNAIEDNGITSPNTTITTGGTIGADNLTVDVLFSTAGAANKSIQASDLASTGLGLGASLTGINDAGSYTSETTVEGAIQELYSLQLLDTYTFTTDGTGVTVGDVVYMTGNNIVSTMPTTASHRAIGMAAETVGASLPVKIVKDQSVLSGVISGATAGVRYYWNGSALVTAVPTGSGAYVWQAGTAVSATELWVDIDFIKRNA
jgi:hypothetical protein